MVVRGDAAAPDLVTDAWVRRTIDNDPAAYHRLGMPPDHRIGEPDPAADVRPWGIDVRAEAPVDEVLEVRAERIDVVRSAVARLEPDGLGRVCPQNPSPGFPPVTTWPVGFCLSLVIDEECAHHGFATRDLDIVEQRHRGSAWR